MQTEELSLRADWLLASLIVMLIGAGSAGAVQQKYHVLYGFQPGNNDGNQPNGTLILDASGNVYGATYLGGPDGLGTVFEVSPPAAKGKPWTKKTLHAFHGTDGNSPVGGLASDAAGNLYGITMLGGDGPCDDWGIAGCGVIFELSPNSGRKWTETVIYNFQGSSDDRHPMVGLVADKLGNLYGTTPGTVFELSPPGGGGSWTETVLYGGSGQYPPISFYGSVILDKRGNLYTTSVFGGIYDAGTVFEVSPPQQKGGSWTETNLYNFQQDEAGGDGPGGPVALDKKGNLYGILYFGGTYGSVFQLSPPKQKGGDWTETVVYDFGGGTDGSGPSGGVILDPAGNLYGNTFYGGQPGGPPGYGTVFKLTPHGKGSWTESILHHFKDHPAENPVGELVLGAHGELYGATASGDNSAPGGAVFTLSSH